MIKYWILLIVFVLFSLGAQAQKPFDWIDFNSNKTNLRISIEKEGLYRIPYQQIKAVGFPVSPQISPTRYQLFFMGKEVPIYIHGIADGSFDKGDYIEFYAFRNDGKMDTDLYAEAWHQPTDAVSLYSEKAIYFLTYTLAPDESGKRITSFYQKNDTLPKETFHHELIDVQFPMRNALGPLYPTSIVDRNNRGALLSNMVEGKGYSGTLWRSIWGYYDPTIAINDHVPQAEFLPKLKTSVQGFINLDRTCKLFINTSPTLPAEPAKKWVVSNYDLKIDSLTFDGSVPFPSSNGTLYFFSGPEEDVWMSLNYLKINFPQGFNARNAKSKVFNLDTAYRDISYIEIENTADTSLIFDLTDYYEMRQIKFDKTGSTLKFMVDKVANQRRKLMLISGIDSVPNAAIEKVVFPQISFGAHDYFIITHESLKEKGNPIREYVNYRSSSEGGSYRPIAITFKEVCDLFYYGHYSPHAIRVMSKYLLENAKPKFMFIIGKGFYNGGDQSLVPSYGLFPNSDYLFSNHLNGASDEPAIPIGRLPATSPEQIFAYLNKVKEHENVNTNAIWRKNTLFLSGGRTLAENISFRRYAENFKSIVEGEYLGSNATIISKTTTDYVEYINIADKVNEGVSLITFFGHANLDFTDIEIGYVSNNALGYRNKGKYPMVVVNGCGSGNIFERNKYSFAEDWVLTPDKGAILFLAHSHIGFSGTLRSYTQTLLETAFANPALINKPMGEIVQQTIKDFMVRSGGSSNYVALANAQQFVLVGDPATKLVFANKPDYMINNSRLSIAPLDAQQSVIAKSDSFKVKIVVANLGITDFNRSQFKVKVERYLPNGTKIDYPVRWFNAIKNEDTLFFNAGTPAHLLKLANGLNRFRVTIDFENTVIESNEGNNIASIDFNFQSGGMTCLAPKEYSIVSNKEVTLVGQNTNVAFGFNFYNFEIDTTINFNSSVLMKSAISDFTTPIWTLNLPLSRDSTVYYWRVRSANPTTLLDTAWANSSFIYINNSPSGWSQSDFPQFSKDTPLGVQRNTPQRKWEFRAFSNNLYVRTYGSANTSYRDNFITLGKDTLVNGNCAGVGVFMIGINQYSGQGYSLEPDFKCGNSLVAGLTNSEYLKDAVDKLIYDGDWFLLVSAGHSYFLQIANAGTWATLASIGISQAAFTAKAPYDGSPFIILGRKGEANSGVIIGGTSSQPGRDMIEYTTNLSNKGFAGLIESTVIGPAIEWGNVFRDFRNDSPKDKWRLDVYGVQESGKEDILFYELPTDGFDIKGIPATLYPKLRLKATLSDSLKQTPPQLKRWQVIYKEIPEGILVCDTTYYRCGTNLAVNIGDSVKMGFIFRNISGNNFDEKLFVKYSILNLNTNATTELYDTLSTLERGKPLYFKTKFNSVNFLGENRITVFVNPFVQKEQNYDNNVIQASFTVRPDKINPLLDVAFDGVHIMDGDLVSASPLITVSLKDENKYFKRTDTIGIEMFLSACDTCVAQRLSFAGANVKWNATPDNNFKIEYKPESTIPDGTYTLKIDAEDLSGNKAGPAPYAIRFQVVNKPTFTNFYPYPNPFSTSMKFVFTLTGNSVPDDMLIRIMTITGTVVKEIRKEELGMIKIGNNISEFAWDGRDQYGDQLANGVYLYKVYIRDNEQNFEKSKTAGDKNFKHDIGKIYLMR